jgi:hypothetical protein
MRSAAERSRELEAEVLALRQELAALKQRTGSPAPSEGTASCPEELRAELARLTAAVEVLQRRNIFPPSSDASTQAPLPASLDTGTHAVSPLAVFFGAGGIFLGWILGSRYARRQERSRRLRF